MHPFRAAVEARDAAAARAALADDVVFHSPVVHRPYAGKEAVGAVLAAALEVFADFGYETELTTSDGRGHALVFGARVGDRDVQGCDFLHDDADGKVDELTVMVRPLSGALALRDAMAARLPGPGAR
jgi:hypothetical protein